MDVISIVFILLRFTNTCLNMKFEGFPVGEGLVAVIANGLAILAVVPHVKPSVHLSWTLMISGQVSLKQVWALKTCITVRTYESLRCDKFSDWSTSKSIKTAPGSVPCTPACLMDDVMIRSRGQSICMSFQCLMPQIVDDGDRARGTKLIVMMIKVSMSHSSNMAIFPITRRYMAGSECKVVECPDE